MTYFYNTKTKLNIVDVSGKKTLAQITKEFGGKAADYKTLNLTEAEEETYFVKVENDNLEKKVKPTPPTPVDLKSEYAKLTTQTEKTNFIAERLGLK